MIYKYDHKKVQDLTERGRTFDVTSIKDLYDIEYKLERISGNAIDYYEIEEVPQADWKFPIISMCGVSVVVVPLTCRSDTI